MSVAAAQASAFYEQVVKDGSVFTFLDDGSFLVFPIHGKEVVPFWSSRTRVQKVQSRHPEYAGYTIHEIPLPEFLETTLAKFGKDGIHVGVNWSGDRLVGYDLPVADLLRNIDYWRKKGVAST